MVKAGGILAIIGAVPMLFLVIFFVFNFDFYIGEHAFFETMPAALYSALFGGLSLIGGIKVFKWDRKGAYIVIGAAIMGLVGGLLQRAGVANLWMIDWYCPPGSACIYLYLWTFIPPLLSLIGGILGLKVPPNYKYVHLAGY